VLEVVDVVRSRPKDGASTDGGASPDDEDAPV
jgi:hypothetical protein